MKEGISHHVARIVSKNHGFEGSMPFVCSFARPCTGLGWGGLVVRDKDKVMAGVTLVVRLGEGEGSTLTLMLLMTPHGDKGNTGTSWL